MNYTLVGCLWVKLTTTKKIYKLHLKAEQGLKNGTICICEETHKLSFSNDETIQGYEIPIEFMSKIKDFFKLIFLL